MSGIGTWEGAPIYNERGINFEKARTGLARKAPAVSIALGLQRSFSVGSGATYYIVRYVATDRDGVTWYAHQWGSKSGVRVDRALFFVLSAHDPKPGGSK